MAVQTDIGQVWEPKYHYHLKLTNAVPIRVKPLCLHLEEEAWLDEHLEEVVDKGIIGPILPGKQV